MRNFLFWLFMVLAPAVSFAAEPLPDRWWPEFPLPSKVLVSEPLNGLGVDGQMTLQTLCGLTAYTVRRQGGGEMLWSGTSDIPSYEEWLDRYAAHTNVPVDRTPRKLWDCVDRYRDSGVLKGYILYHADTAKRTLYEGKPEDWSANAATALCAPLGGVIVEERLEETAKAHGLKLLADLRGRDEAWLWKEYGDKLSHAVLGRQDPRNAVMRDAIVAMGTAMVSAPGKLYGDALRAMQPGAPILGWGLGMEDEQTGPSSRWGLIQTATNWCVNLAPCASGKTGLDYPFKKFAQADTSQDRDGSDTRYVSFVMSDGDNVQWLMMNFCLGREAQQYWASPERGKIALGWTICAADLLQLCPYTLDHLRDTATHNDDFLLFGGGYYYPDWFGKDRGMPDLLAQHARRLGKYMDKCGIHSFAINAQDWDGTEAMAAYETYVREMPATNAIFAIQYAPYTAGGGAIKWIPRQDGRRVPVISARNAIWTDRGNDPREGTPGRVAAMLNEWASRPVQAPEDRFAWVIVHAWSWFKNVPPDAPATTEEVDQTTPPAEAARGYMPAAWCASRLASNVRVVTPGMLAGKLAGF
jgi:hypothetical protein